MCNDRHATVKHIDGFFLIVGHTHDKIDRFFSRLRVALRGHDYFTVCQMMDILRNGLPTFDFTHSHLSRLWNWKALERFDIPPLVGMARTHAICFFRSNGIWVKWKQYLTSEEWSRPVMLLAQHEMAEVAAWLPESTPLGFSDKEKQKKLAWLDKLEILLADASGQADARRGDMEYLRLLINGMLPCFTDGPTIQTIINDLRTVGSSTVETSAVGVTRSTLPADALVMFPGADQPDMPVNTLIRIPNRWEPPPCKLLTVQSFVICKGDSDTKVDYDGVVMQLPFVLGEVLYNSTSKADDVVVQWYVPPTAPMVRMGGGRKKRVIDLFGVWTPLDQLELSTVIDVKLPPVLVPTSHILEFNFELDGGKLPFDVLDILRVKHGIDVTALTTSATALGARYRAHVMMTLDALVH